MDMLVNMLMNSEILSSVETDQPLISLTFDDGPHPEHTPKILKALKDGGMRATFFVIGKNVLEHPELVRQMVADGHEVANHSVGHPNLNELATLEDIHTQIVDAQRIIREAAGVEATLFRAPCGLHDKRVWQVLQEAELPSVLLSLDTVDWNAKSCGDSVYAKATDGLAQGDIVLMHEWPVCTASVIADIVKTIADKGLRSVTVSELVKHASALKRY